jgi:lipoprotein-releasing system permease protein
VEGWRFSWLIAARYLWSGRPDAAVTIMTIFSVLGVTVGVVTLNVVMAVMTGFQVKLREKILGADAHVVVRHLSGRISEWQEVKGTLQKVGGVSSIAAFTSNQALIQTKRHANGVLVRGVEPEGAVVAQLKQYVVDPKIVENLFSPTPVLVEAADGSQDHVTLPSVLVGRELARQFSLLPGERVSILSSHVSSTPFGLLPKFRRFSVVGQYSSGLIEYENGIVYVALQAAQEFFKMGNAVSGLEIRVEDIDEAPAIAQELVETLGGPGTGFYAQPWTETNRAFFEALKLEKRVYFIVLLLIIVMASFSIVSALIMIVVEKRKDIAILRTIGASSAMISRVFRFQGAIIGGVGVSCGVVLGYLVCTGLDVYGFPIDERIFQMSSLPIHIDPFNFFLVALSAFLICLVATEYPARRASGLQPVDALRYE